MPVASWLRILALVAAELLLWILPAIGFLVVYMQNFDGPASAVLPHLRLIGSVAIACMGLRWLVEAVRPTRALRIAVVLLYSVLLAGLLIYYFVVLVGLDNWGRVATWQMMRIYVDQWHLLANVLNIPAVVVPLGLLLMLVGIGVLFYFLLPKLDWPQRLAAANIRPRVAVVASITCLAVLGVSAGETVYVAYDNGEPIMLSLNASLGKKRSQSNRTEGARLLDRREAEAASQYQAGKLEEPRNVILIVGDALRASRMGMFGYERETTPYLDGLKDEGRYAYAERVFSTCTESYCGLMSIARSKFVHEFSRSSLTLQQALKRHEFEIGLVLGGDHTNFYGLAELLGPADVFWDGSMGGAYVNDDKAVVNRIRELEKWSGKPTFLQVHLMSTHALGLRQDGLTPFGPASNYYRAVMGIDDTEGRAAASNFYDNGMLNFDEVIKELLDSLGSKGYLDNAVVVITGDHGECLGEHGHFGHRSTPHREALDVPLLILRYGYEGEPLPARASASQVDIAPTVMDELGLPVPESWSGSGLRNEEERPFVYFQQAQFVGLIDFRDPELPWKFWKDLSNGRSYAYDARDTEQGAVNRIAEASDEQRSRWLLEVLPASSAIDVESQVAQQN